MSNYRRNRVPGGTYFFTVNLHDRNSTLLVDQVAALRDAVRRTRVLAPLHIDAWVVLPEHMHALWTFPEGDTDYSRRWHAIKMAFSKKVPKDETRSVSQQHRRERAIWQRRYWEHTIRDERDYAAHADYIHFNPVKHGFAARVADWPFSSFHRAVGLGHYPQDWGGTDDGEQRGERP